MTKKYFNIFGLIITVFLVMVSALVMTNISIPKAVADDTGVPMFRMYNKFSGEHFYTKDVNEKNSLIRLGWNYEGVGWTAPSSGAPVHRIYNPVAGDHHYSTNWDEVTNAVANGWNYEGVGWYSGGNAPIYREYSPLARTGAHNYTSYRYEHDALITIGWIDESVGWYGLSDADITPKVSIEQDGAYASIEGTINVNGSGGYHAKVHINSADSKSVVSFGIQVDPGNPQYPGKAAFLIENVKSNAAEAGPAGKEYLWVGGAAIGRDIKVRLSWYEDQTVNVYVEDKLMFQTKANLRPPFTFAAEGSVRRAGESIDSWVKNVTVKAGKVSDPAHLGIVKPFDPRDAWNYVDHRFFGLQEDMIPGEVHDSNDAFNTNGGSLYKPSFRFYGSPNIPPQYDWDTSFQVPGYPHPISAAALVNQKQ